MSVHDQLTGNMGRKPFQEATVRHAIARLCDTAGSRRFLVADEVGLGKTLVAQGILQQFPRESRPLNVFYVCSSLTIATQNRSKLLEVLAPEQRKGASVEVDRPTLLPWSDPDLTTPFTLFTLTPGTLPMKGSSRGRVDERAAIWCLLREGLRAGGTALVSLERHLKLVQDATWNKEMQSRALGNMPGRLRELAAPFVQATRHYCNLPDGNDRSIAEALLRRLTKAPLQTIQSLRKLLGSIGLRRLRPDIVILDEFQRFFELLEAPTQSIADDPSPSGDGATGPPSDNDPDAHGLLSLLLGTDGRQDGPAILLLSATPYRPPTGGVDGAGLGHYEQFFQLLTFLFGPGEGAKVEALRVLFRMYGSRLHEAPVDDPELIQLRDKIEALLFTVIARTERVGLVGDASSVTSPVRQAVPLQGADVHVYRHLWDSATDDDKPFVTPYWSSIPFPLQMLDQRYQLRKRANPAPLVGKSGDSIVLRADSVRRYAKCSPPHPRMRGLLEDINAPLLRLPWFPPTRPWWQLDAPFQEAVNVAGDAGPSKVLLFSRFRAVPRAVASILSYESERQVYAGETTRDRKYDYHGRHGGAQPEGSDPDPELSALPSPSFNWQARQRGMGERDLDHLLLSLFVPAPRLGEIGDPQRIDGFSSGKLRRSDSIDVVAERLRREFADLPGEVVVQDGPRTTNGWRALVRLERSRPETWPHFRRALEAWANAAVSEGARSVVRAWISEGNTNWRMTPIAISQAEVEELAELALAGPGVVLYRAATRVFDNGESPFDRMRMALNVALGSLRTYLDEPEFHLTLAVSDRHAPNHPADVRRAVWSGNLEAVLDEYFAMQAGLGTAEIDPGREVKALQDLEQALGLRVSSVRVQNLEPGSPISLRCHAAMPFGLTADKDVARELGAPEARPDTLRQAFNSPFRPFVLATTSIGQEGLDFHVYCDHLVHWDLPASPVDLEQREGRINRFGGLSIRKSLIRKGGAGAALPLKGSPWMILTRALTESAEGMSPWWVTDDSTIRRTLFIPPLSRQDGELDRLLAALSHYRLALGQSDPEQLLLSLHRRIQRTTSDTDREKLLAWFRDIRINLAPVQRQLVD